MSEQKGVFVLMGLFLLFCRCPVCFLVSRLDSFVFVSLFDSFVIIALFDSFNVIARLDRAIQIEGAPVKPHPAGNDGKHKLAGDNSKKFLITFINKLVNLFMLIIFFEPESLLPR